MRRFQLTSSSFSLAKAIIITLGIVSLAGVGLVGCQSQETPTTPVAPPTPAVSTTPATPTPSTSPTPAPAVTPPPPPAENVNVPPPVVTPPTPQPVLPTLVSVTSNLKGSDLQSAEFARVTAVFRFDATCAPGYYSITLLSGSDTFGVQELEWYRVTKQMSFEWPVYAGKQAYYRLKNDEPITDIFQTQVSYKKFVSLTTVPRDTPSDLERAIVDQVNQERAFRGLSTLTWDDNLYKQAIQRVKEVGEEGKLLPPPAGQTNLEAAYVSNTGAIPEAGAVLSSWIVSESYFAVITNPTIKSLALRADSYNNHKFYIIGLFK